MIQSKSYGPTNALLNVRMLLRMLKLRFVTLLYHMLRRMPILTFETCHILASYIFHNLIFNLIKTKFAMRSYINCSPNQSLDKVIIRLSTLLH